MKIDENKRLFDLTVSEFRQLLKEERLYLTYKEASDVFGASYSYIAKLVSNGSLKKYPNCRLNFEECQEFFTKHSTKNNLSVRN